MSLIISYTVICNECSSTHLDVVLHRLVSRTVRDEELEVLVLYLTGRGSDVLLPHVLDYYTHSALTQNRFTSIAVQLM